MPVYIPEPSVENKTWQSAGQEDWRINENWNYGSRLLRVNADESFSVAEKHSVGKQDVYAGFLQGVYSDVIFEKGEWDEKSVNNAVMKGRHVGYENFQPFIYGDHKYQKALFRTVLASTGPDRGVVEQFQVVVDVPDLIDKGSAELVDANYNLHIDFNKHFHIAPEVVVTMRSGTSSEPVVPTIVNISETGFDVYLQNALNGSKTTGRFIWMATGY